MLNTFRKNEKAFTGLEAAIVLTAFVVVAAVFSYVVLGAGFFTSDTAKATIHTGVDQATTSIEFCGDVIAKENSTVPGTVGSIVLTLQLTAGGSPVDIGANSNAGKLVVSYMDSSKYEPELNWTKNFIGDNDEDSILEQNEKVELTIKVPSGSLLANSTTATDAEFTLQVKPAVGATLPITRTIPPQIDDVILLN